jgi:DNA helicase II / ATP-dependent DNA helicase PcrA
VGADALDGLGAAFVGTIHAYCFRLLQQHVPRYETFDVLDEQPADGCSSDQVYP